MNTRQKVADALRQMALHVEAGGAFDSYTTGVEPKRLMHFAAGGADPHQRFCDLAVEYEGIAWFNGTRWGIFVPIECAVIIEDEDDQPLGIVSMWPTEAGDEGSLSAPASTEYGGGSTLQ
jgi:hypothetical protein